MKRQYVVVTGKPSFVIDNHWRECKLQNSPYVAIHPIRKFAWVELDMTSTKNNLDEQTNAQMFNLMLRYTGNKEHVFCGNALCRAERVLKSDAEKLAGEMFQLVEEGRPRLKPLPKH